MAVKRITANIATQDVPGVRQFYAGLFGLEVVMDMGWITTLAGPTSAPVQISAASQGGSDTPVPDLSIEVTDIDTTYARAQALGHPIPYELTDEPWGVRRFYVTDPAGKVLNILSHST